MSSQSEQILLTADEMTPLAEPEFLLVRRVVASEDPYLYTLRVKVDISLPVTFRYSLSLIYTLYFIAFSSLSEIIREPYWAV